MGNFTNFKETCFKFRSTTALKTASQPAPSHLSRGEAHRPSPDSPKYRGQFTQLREKDQQIIADSPKYGGAIRLSRGDSSILFQNCSQNCPPLRQNLVPNNLSGGGRHTQIIADSPAPPLHEPLHLHTGRHQDNEWTTNRVAPHQHGVASPQTSMEGPETFNEIPTPPTPSGHDDSKNT